MVFLLDLGRNQVEIRKGGDQFYEDDGQGQAVFDFRVMGLRDKYR